MHCYSDVVLMNTFSLYVSEMPFRSKRLVKKLKKNRLPKSQLSKTILYVRLQKRKRVFPNHHRATLMVPQRLPPKASLKLMQGNPVILFFLELMTSNRS